MKKRVAIFASGNGSNFEALAVACQKGEIEADVALCFTDHPEAYVVERARKLNVPVVALRLKDFPSKKYYEEAILKHLKEVGVDFIFLAGYMKIVGDMLLDEYRDKIVNIHPSLLPAFKGVDAIGQAMNYGVKVYGVTVHYVDNTLDGGKIISQDSLHYEGTDREELEPMIHRLEHRLYVETAARLMKK